MLFPSAPHLYDNKGLNEEALHGVGARNPHRPVERCANGYGVFTVFANCAASGLLTG